MSDCQRCSGDLPAREGHCHLCHEDFPEGTSLEELSDHLRVLHPDVFGEGPARWPDGQLVVLDDTLEPKDFLDGPEE